MPELPDLEYVVPLLREGLVGGRVVDAVVKEPIVLRVAVEGDLAAVLVGRRLEAVERRGAWVCFTLEDRELVVNLMLAGRFRLTSPTEKRERSLCFALVFDGERELRYLDDRKMGKAYVLARGTAASVIPGFAQLGIEVLSPAFTLDVFRSLAAKRRDQVRAFLMDKSALSAIGNAYADEILFAARIHPKTRMNQLKPADLETLYGAIGQVLRAAVDEIARRGAPMDEKVRDFLQVRNRKGEPCPRCGAKLRAVRVLSADAFFCPDCQQARRSQFVDFRKVPKP